MIDFGLRYWSKLVDCNSKSVLNFSHFFEISVFILCSILRAKKSKQNRMKAKKRSFRQRVEVMVKNLEAIVHPPEPPTILEIRIRTARVLLVIMSNIAFIIIIGLILIYVWYVIFDYFSETQIPVAPYCNCDCCRTGPIQTPPIQSPLKTSSKSSHRVKIEETFKYFIFGLQNLYVLLLDALMFCVDFGIPFCAFGKYSYNGSELGEADKLRSVPKV